MRDDLLDAQAAVCWAVSQTPSVQKMFEAWGNDKPYRFVPEPHPEMGKVLVKFRDVRQPPASINAEVGAIINSIRSSLDLVATALANRHGTCKPKEAYFPVADSLVAFTSLKFKGAKLVKGLPVKDRDILESFEPYRGGNSTLVALHDLDNLRKHRRLIEVRLLPTVILVSPLAHGQGLEFPSQWPGFKDDAVMAWYPIGANAAECGFEMPVQIVFNEVDFAGTRPVIPTLKEFADFATSIIAAFDF